MCRPLSKNHGLDARTPDYVTIMSRIHYQNRGGATTNLGVLCRMLTTYIPSNNGSGGFSRKLRGAKELNLPNIFKEISVLDKCLEIFVDYYTLGSS